MKNDNIKWCYHFHLYIFCVIIYVIIFRVLSFMLPFDVIIFHTQQMLSFDVIIYCYHFPPFFFFLKTWHTPYFYITQRVRYRYTVWFQKCTFDLSKKCTRIPKNRFFWFFGQNSFGYTFYKDKIYSFEISMKRRIFWYLIPDIRRRKFSSLRRDNE